MGRSLVTRLLVAVSLVVSLLTLVSPGAGAAEPEPTIVMDYRNAPLSQIAREVALKTGMRLILDEGIQRRVTLSVDDRVTPGEARELLTAALVLGGFALLPAPGGTHRIVPLELSTPGVPRLEGPAGDRERLVVTLLRLESASAPSIAPVLRRYVGPGSQVHPYAPTNSLVVATREGRLAELVELIHALDESAAESVIVVPLRYAGAERTAEVLEQAFPGVGPRDLKPEFQVDARTNSLIVRVPESLVGEVRSFIDRLDVPRSSRSGLHVVRLKNADAEGLAQQLSALGSDAGSPLSGRSYTVVADAPTNSLLIQSNAETFDDLSFAISELDHIPAQVEIEVLLLELQFARQYEFGVDAIIPLIIPNDIDDQAAVATVGDAGSLLTELPDSPFVVRVTGKPFLVPITSGGIPTSAVLPQGAIQITAGDGNVQVRTIQNPHIQSVIGEEHRVFSGEQVPIPVERVSQEGTIDDPLEVTQTIERQDVGVDLRVRPSSATDEVIVVELDLQVTAVIPTSTELATAQQGPDLRRFELQTQVRLVDGAIVVVATSPDERLETRIDRVPFLSSIPILGRYFQTVSEITTTRRSLVAIQARHLRTPAEQRAESIQRRIGFERMLARAEPRESGTGAPYALLVATRGERAQADSVANRLTAHGTVEVIEWSFEGNERFDVYLSGFEGIAQAGAAARRLRDQGYRPRLTAFQPPDR